MLDILKRWVILGMQLCSKSTLDKKKVCRLLKSFLEFPSSLTTKRNKCKLNNINGNVSVRSNINLILGDYISIA